ncbi:hypothetical protein F8388_022664, partial [Cannabis sativa]
MGSSSVAIIGGIDFCVAASNSPGFKDGGGPKTSSFSGLQKTWKDTSNALGSRVTPVGVTQIPGLNTLGISLARIDYAPWGINPPHTHPRASEILTVIEGSLEVGFVTSNPDNQGDVFVFPVGLIITKKMLLMGNTIAIAALSSQNAGVITIANAVFGSKPDIPVDILAKAFQLDKTVVHEIVEFVAFELGQVDLSWILVVLNGILELRFKLGLVLGRIG